jgi:hypothetical protein
MGAISILNNLTDFPLARVCRPGWLHAGGAGKQFQASQMEDGRCV